MLPEINTEANVWQYISYVLAFVIVAIVGWWIKQERPRIAKEFKENEKALKDIIEKQMKIQARMTSYLKDLYDRVGEAFNIHKDLKGYTEFDFDAKKKGDDNNA